MLCTNCLEVIEDDSIFCSKCGAKQVRKVICANCHAELTPKDNFCRICGTPVQKVGCDESKDEDQPTRATICTSRKGFYAGSKQAVTLLGAAYAMYKVA